MEAHGILAQEVQRDFVLLVVKLGNVLHSQTAGAHRISFVFILLIAHSQGQLVNQIRRRPDLSVLSTLASHFLLVIRPDLVNVLF